MERIRWGIIGAGSIADTVAGEFAFVPQAELVAVASRDPDRSRQFARKHGIPAAHRDYRALIESRGVDVVYIATTHPQHRDIALAAIAAGKAVLVEKAFTSTLAGTQEVVAAATEAGVFAMEAMWTRFLPAVEAAREVVAWGRIGQVLGVQGDLCAYRPYNPASRLWDPATGGGAILDLGVYTVSMAEAFLGAARQVHCVGRYAPNGVESAATMSIGYAGGGTAALTCGFDVHGPAQMAVYGTKGWVEIQRDCLLAGRIQSATMPLSDTVEVMRVLDTCLGQLGRPQQEAEVTI